MTTGIVFDQAFLLHEQSPNHPERRERLCYTWDQLVEEGLAENSAVRFIRPYPAPEAAVLAVHTPAYLNFLKNSSMTGGCIDLDTVVPIGLYSGALLAAGGAMAAADAVLSGDVSNAFALVRPPGHHAGTGFGGGFCYLNNIAIMIRHIQASGLRKILLLDWDAHHGNGSEEIFFQDDSVLFISVHQSPLYPGTGSIDTVGAGAGAGYTVNLPIPPGSSDDVYRFLMKTIIIPLARIFQPEFIAVSAGQDNHFSDPLTNLALTASGYRECMAEMVTLADELCGGRLVAVLEGGYSVDTALPYTNLGIIAALAGLDGSGIREPRIYSKGFERSYDPSALEETRRMVQALIRMQKPYWGIFRGRYPP